ncbi:plancitoxin-1 isoform X2 [Harpegnathos saltator]|uniref:plancitoxin-1 isoform X2 n=1 Tax=Harpegnathos saltator TaxID=610380 RepID=UPI000DBEE179|nr:plancitoxin-1 isoform X2 [Harpegnathos saltator]
MFPLLYVSILLFGCNTVNARTLQCRDENNQPVDWYVLYKLPKVHESSIPIIRDGLAYLYITNDTVDKGWQLSSKEISAENSIPGNTLAPLYDDSKAANIFWALYNDDPPDKSANGKYGHAKGAVIVNKRWGFWLIHSVPNYPPTPNCGEDSGQEKVDADPNPAPGNRSEYDYPSTGKNYGQSFLCISVDANQFDLIGEQLIYNQVTVYKKNIPEKYDKLFPKLTDAARQKKIKEPPYNSKVLLRSSGSVQFWSFAKSDKWQKELYDDFVAPTLNSDLYAETWLHGRGRLPSDCINVRTLNICEVVELFVSMYRKFGRIIDMQ